MSFKESTRKFNPALYILARLTIIPYLKFRYKIRSKNKTIFKELEPPFVLVPNHVSMFDPPMVNIFVPHRVHFVMSDANLRTKLSRWIYCKMCNVIPKTKAISDSTAVRKIVALVRKKRVICIFAEGRSSWDGVTHDIFYSTAKLLRILKVPVVVPLIRGGYLTHPRWATTIRPGRLIIEYKKIFNGPELAKMTLQDIHERLIKELWHDDYEFQRTTGQKYKSKKGAEYLERLLFVCPECHQRTTLRSEKNRFFCTFCNFEARYTSEGLLHPHLSDKHPIRTITAWARWQNAFIERTIQDMIKSNSSEAIFADRNVALMTGHGLAPLEHLAKGAMALYLDRFTFKAENGQEFVFPLENIKGVQVLLANKFEFYFKDNLYNFEFENPRTSGYKYLVAIQKIAPEKAELE